MQKEEKEMNRVTLYPDGKYRWVYEVSMMRNPSILIDIFKVLGISLGIVWLFTVLLDIFDDDLRMELWVEIRGHLHDGQEGTCTPTDAPSGEESPGVGSIGRNSGWGHR